MKGKQSVLSGYLSGIVGENAKQKVEGKDW